MKRTRSISDVDVLYDGVTSGDRTALGRAITLLESRRPEDHDRRLKLLERCSIGPGNSLRIAITGAPGSGKSTLIDALGMMFAQKGHRIAVLAVDPTSDRTGGSILGDKTRMERLSKDDRAFIRPSPTSGILGGVAEMTRETIVLCEAAGYDRIIVETVGVGQSEIRAAGMVDITVLLGLSGTGDALQGIKRGILEVADLVVINKADGAGEAPARRTATELKTALRILRGTEKLLQVIPVSALHGNGLKELAEALNDLISARRVSGAFDSRRAEQRETWFGEAVTYRFSSLLESDPSIGERRRELTLSVRKGAVDPYGAADELVRSWLRRQGN